MFSFSDPVYDEKVTAVLGELEEAEDEVSLDDAIEEEEEEASEELEAIKTGIQTGEKVLDEIEKSIVWMEREEVVFSEEGTDDDNKQFEKLYAELQYKRKRAESMVGMLKKEEAMVPKRAKMAAIMRKHGGD